MRENIKKQRSIQVAVAGFILFTVWWVVLQINNLPHDSGYNQLYGGVYGIIALWGGVWGIVIARKWGGLHSVIGKSILLFALGLLSQEVGQIAYTYYISFLHQPVPYPSIGDFFFYMTIPLYIFAVLYLGQASGIHFSLLSFKSKLQAILVPAGMLIFSYLLFLQGYKFDLTQPLKTFLDLGVPLGQAIYISFAILTYTLTRGLLGGMMKKKVLFILFALFAQYSADWTFLYQASRGTWYTGGINDYMYMCAYFLMAFALLQFNAVLRNLREKK